MNAMTILISAIASFGADIPREDVNCMARAVYHEARGEERVGQSAVAHVILNRVYDTQNGKHHPNTVCDVVYARYQFTDLDPYMQIKDFTAWREAVALSILAITGNTDDPTDGALWYYNPNKVKKPKFLAPKKLSSRFGNHEFYLMASR